MTGIGTMALGTGSLGTGDPSEANELPDDPIYMSIWVSPQSKDYEIDSVTGTLGEVSPILGRVIYCLTQRKGSSSLLPEDGVQYPTVIDDAFDGKFRNAVRNALRQLTDVERVVRIESIDVEKWGGRVRGILHYTDLTTGRPELARF